MPRFLLAIATFLAFSGSFAFAQVSSQAELDASGRAVLDVVEGRSEMAPISVPYGQALAAAHRIAIASGKRFAPPPSIRFHQISKTGEGMLSVVTVGTPSDDAKSAIAFLRSREARPANVTNVRTR